MLNEKTIYHRAYPHLYWHIKPSSALLSAHLSDASGKRQSGLPASVLPAHIEGAGARPSVNQCRVVAAVLFPEADGSAIFWPPYSSHHHPARSPLKKKNRDSSLLGQRLHTPISIELSKKVSPTTWVDFLHRFCTPFHSALRANDDATESAKPGCA